MNMVRDFLVTFCVAALILMGLISVVFIGSALMNEFVSWSNFGHALIASAILSVILAVPMAAAGTPAGYFDFDGNKTV